MREATNHLTPSPALTDPPRVRPITAGLRPTSTIYLVDFLPDARVLAHCDLLEPGRLSANMIYRAQRGIKSRNTRAKETATMTEGNPSRGKARLPGRAYDGTFTVWRWTPLLN